MSICAMSDTLFVADVFNAGSSFEDNSFNRLTLGSEVNRAKVGSRKERL